MNGAQGMTVTTGGDAELERHRRDVPRPGAVRNGRRRARRARVRRAFGNVVSVVVALVAAIAIGGFLTVLTAYYTGGPFGIGAVVIGFLVGSALVGIWVWRTGWPIRLRARRGGDPR